MLKIYSIKGSNHLRVLFVSFNPINLRLSDLTRVNSERVSKTMGVELKAKKFEVN